MNNRMDSLDRKIDTQIGQKIDNQIGGVNKRIDQVNKRLEAIMQVLIDLSKQKG